MRWPFRRPRVAAVPQPAWRDLAPTPRIVTAALGNASVSGGSAFVRELPSRWHQPPALRPLAHDIRPDTVGLLAGLASVVPGRLTPRHSTPADLRWLTAVPTRGTVAS